MAGLFEKFGEVAKTAADKTSDAIELARLNSKVAKEEQKIKTLKEEIGDHFLELFKAGALEETFLAEKARAVEECEKEKASYEEMMKGIKTKI
ncbi:hypothetical protein [Clostridium aminobutyricum]|uniref:Uncharacterized protein n=1 Tax=Clostridium aminobutyricum TaxID=33953 RepID=A0A939D9Q6_CLOAM|nr:hypothetical protein [Clostridium aminobutyricum]MBN7773313.1 hypothetical protein [Clostridium aminobutyricum]